MSIALVGMSPRVTRTLGLVLAIRMTDVETTLEERQFKANLRALKPRDRTKITRPVHNIRSD